MVGGRILPWDALNIWTHPAATGSQRCPFLARKIRADEGNAVLRLVVPTLGNVAVYRQRGGVKARGGTSIIGHHWLYEQVNFKEKILSRFLTTRDLIIAAHVYTPCPSELTAVTLSQSASCRLWTCPNALTSVIFEHPPKCCVRIARRPVHSHRWFERNV